MIKNAGSTFTKAVSSMYRSTHYVPKVNKQKTGTPIQALHGVTQGRKSSTSLFSFAISEIPNAVTKNPTFLQGNNVLQLADDASVLETTFDGLSIALKEIVQKVQ